MPVRGRHSEGLQRGFTLLELMIVIAIIGVAMYVMGTAFNRVTKANLVEDVDELAAMLRRASQLAIESGEQHRVVFDMEKGVYRIEVCQGAVGLVRQQAVEQEQDDKEKTEEAVARGKERLRDLPEDALAVGDPDEAVKRAKAIAGHHIADRTCVPATEGVSGVNHGITKQKVQVGERDAEWIRNLNPKAGIKFAEIWVQHRDEGVKEGEVAVYFFANGSAEKAVIEIQDDDKNYRSVMVNGLTGRVTQKSDRLADVDEVMLRNILGDKEKAREQRR